MKAQPIQKPLQWVTFLIARFEDQLPVKTGPLKREARLLLNHSQACLVNVSRLKFSMVIGGLVKTLQAVTATKCCSEQDLFDSQMIILDTLERCLSQERLTRTDEAVNAKIIIQEMCMFLQLSSDCNQAIQLKEKASRVIYCLSIGSFSHLFSRISLKLKAISSDSTPLEGSSSVSDFADVELMQHVHLEITTLIKLLKEICYHKPFRKESNIPLLFSLEKAIWNWMDSYPSQFEELQAYQNEELNECCECLFDQLDAYAAESVKRKATIWPMQMMLLILCPKVLGEIYHTTCGAPCPLRLSKQKSYFDSVKKALKAKTAHTSKQQLLAAACIAGVKLCKAATYIDIVDSANVFFGLLQSIIDCIKNFLFSPTKPLFKYPTPAEIDVMIDCFVALFRLNYNNEIFRMCLNAQSVIPHQLVLVMALYRIAVQVRLSWWPKITLVYSRSNELRNMLNETITRVSQGATSVSLASGFACSGYVPSKVSQSLHKVSYLTGKLRDRGSISSTSDELSPTRRLLFWLIRLMCIEPTLFLNYDSEKKAESEKGDFRSSTLELMNGLVSLVANADQLPELAPEVMEAILCLHQPCNILQWNPVSRPSSVETFWHIHSQVVFTVCQKLLHHQLHNYPDILRWLKQLLVQRNEFLAANRDICNFGSSDPLCKQAAFKLETVCFLYLWSLDNNAAVTALSMFRLMCQEMEIRYAPEELPQRYIAFSCLADSSDLQTIGRVALQKSINSYLRKQTLPSVGCCQAWQDTYAYWQDFARYLKSYPKSKFEDSSQLIENLTKLLACPKTQRNVEVESDLILKLWANMSGFLCASAASGGVSLDTVLNSNIDAVTPSTPQTAVAKDQYSSASQFLNHFLSLLFLQSENLEAPIIRQVKESCSFELSPLLYECVFEQIKTFTDRFFDSNSEVLLSYGNTQFIEHAVYIMKNILEFGAAGKSDLKISCVEPILLTFCRYAKCLTGSHKSAAVRGKLCQLMEVMMKQSEYLTFRSEIRFRNKLIEHVTDWIICSGCNPMYNQFELAVCLREFRDLNLSCMNAIAVLMKGLPLQPDETVRDAATAKSQLFQKYFTLFMNLLNDCTASDSCTGAVEGDNMSTKSVCAELAGTSLSSAPSAASRQQGENKTDLLRNATIESMSCLLAANIDTGLIHSIGLGYHKDTRVRLAFVQVLIKILQQGTEFETLNETVMADRYEELIRLVTMITADGEMPVVNALVSVVQYNQLDELAVILVTVSAWRNLLNELLWKLFSLEVKLAEAPTTLFRGNTLASKVMGYCFKLYGASYLRSVLRDFVNHVIIESNNRCFEVNPSRLKPGENAAGNAENLMFLVEMAFGAITNSADRFPVQLKSTCNVLYNVVNARFPNNGLLAVGMILFLRFFNPAVVSPFEFGLTDVYPSHSVKRGLMLVSKILQQIANQADFVKDTCLRSFNSFIRSKFDAVKRFVSNITLESCSRVAPSSVVTFVNDATVSSLHRLLWKYQDQISEYLTSVRSYELISRRLVTLLAQMGPAEHKTSESGWNSADLTSNQFEELMAKENVTEKEEFKSVKATNVFYQSGFSRNGYPTFYFIGVRYKVGELNDDMLIWHVLLTLKPFHKKPFDLVVDLTHTSAENRFRTELLQKWFILLPEIALQNLHAVYVINCNSWVCEYACFHERLLSPLQFTTKLVFLENLRQLSKYTDPDQQRLPASTLALEEDLKVFPNAFRICHKEIKCTVKVGPAAVQVTTAEPQKILGHSVILTDVYYAYEIEEVLLVDDNTIMLTILNESSPLSIVHNEYEQIVSAIVHIKSRFEISQPSNLTHTKMRARDVPGTLLNLALLNLGSTDPSLRTAAYNLLCALSAMFDFQIENELLETEGLLIPVNNTLFINLISKKIAASEPHLTFEFIEEFIQGFRQSGIEMKHLCLEYVTPWLQNLPKFCRQNGDESKRRKVVQVVENLITMTVEEREMYPSIQTKIWSNMGRAQQLLDLMLDCLIKKSVASGLGSRQAEVMADTTVALAAANVSFVSKNVLNRIMTLLEKTSLHPQKKLEEHIFWEDIAILVRYVLFLSFNNRLEVVENMPVLFQLVTLLVGTGPLCIRASVHGIVINFIHSLYTCSYPFSDSTKRTLRLALTEFSLPKFYRFFGLTHLTVKSVASTAFRVSPLMSLPVHTHVGYSPSGSGVDDNLSLSGLETIADALIELLEACNKDIPERLLCDELANISYKFALKYNPALQSRALVVFSCLSKETDEVTMKQLLVLFLQFIKRRDDTNLLVAAIMSLTRLLRFIPANSIILRTLFWISVIILQVEDVDLYEYGLALLEQNLRTLDSYNVFESDTLQHMMMETRPALEWEFKAFDQEVGLSFKHNFHFALVAYLLKGYRHPLHTVVGRTAGVLKLLLGYLAKSTKRDKFEVTQDNIAYLAALLPVSEEVQRRCPFHMSTMRSLNLTRFSGNLSSATLDCVRRSRFSTSPVRKPIHGFASKSISLQPAPRRTAVSRQNATFDNSEPSEEVAFSARVHRRNSVPSVIGAVESVTQLVPADPFQESPKSDIVCRDTAVFFGTEFVGSAHENNTLLNPNVLKDPAIQALTLTVLATLVRNSTDEKETRILFEYLAEASVLFPDIFPVIHSLLDHRITQVLQLSHDASVLRAALLIVQNMVPSQETVAPQQHVTFLQAYGFGGLWRFARPFLPKASLGQMLSPEACTCLERLIGNLGDVPPLTPPPLSPHVGTSFPTIFSGLQPEESS